MMLLPSSEKTQRTNTQWDAEGRVWSEDTQGYLFSMQHWRAVPEPVCPPPPQGAVGQLEKVRRKTTRTARNLEKRD